MLNLFQDAINDVSSSIPRIPKKLEEWNVSVIESLLGIPTVESEIFDFKGSKISDLAIHICAMANTETGVLVLGIEERRSNTDQLLGFSKNGFDPSDEEKIRGSIRNYAHNVDPTPKVEIKTVTDLGRTYLIVRVEGEDLKKPYFIKGKGQCYVRVMDSSVPATGSIVLNLLSNRRQGMKNVNLLRVSAILLKEALMNVSQDIRGAGASELYVLAPIDLALIRSATSNTEDFLVENNLLGRHTTETSQIIGLTYHFNKIEQLNVMIEKYNNAIDPERRTYFRNAMDNWTPNRNEVTQVTNFLEDLINRCAKFIASNSD